MSNYSGKVTTGNPSFILWRGKATPELSSIPIKTDWYAKDAPLADAELKVVTGVGLVPGGNIRRTEDPLLKRGLRNLCPVFFIHWSRCQNRSRWREMEVNFSTEQPPRSSRPPVVDKLALSEQNGLAGTGNLACGLATQLPLILRRAET